MVAITVILAAVIGAFVLGLGDSVQETAPNTNINADWGANHVVISHAGGETLDPDEIVILANGEDVEGDWGTSDISAGDSVTVSGNDIGGDAETIQVVWQSGGQSSTLATFDVPEDLDTTE